jgi:DnaK suppressor protein
MIGNKMADNVFEELPKFEGFCSQKELDEYKIMLDEKFVETREKLEASMERIKATEMEATGDTSYSLHMADQGTDSMEREKAFLFAQRDEKYLHQLEKAMERVKAGTFGICRDCGVKITSPRIRAVPTTNICIDCKSK